MKCATITKSEQPDSDSWLTAHCRTSYGLAPMSTCKRGGLGRTKRHLGLPAMNDCGTQDLAWLPPYGLRYACKFRATSTLPGPLREFTRKLDFLRSSRLPRDGESASRTGSSDPHRMRLELPILRFFISRPLVALDGGSFRYGARDTNPTDLTQSRPEARPPKCVWNRFLQYQP